MTAIPSDQFMEAPNTLREDSGAREPPDLISSADIRTIAQVGVFILALLAACYVAGEIILPIVLAFVLMLYSNL